jgi:hypothetical protein
MRSTRPSATRTRASQISLPASHELFVHVPVPAFAQHEDLGRHLLIPSVMENDGGAGRGSTSLAARRSFADIDRCVSVAGPAPAIIQAARTHHSPDSIRRCEPGG